MAIPVSFRWDEGFVKRVDEARGDVPRSVFVRRALEFWLEGPSERWRRAEREVAELYGLEPPGASEQALGSSGRAGVRGRVPASAPAEQPGGVYVGSEVEAAALAEQPHRFIEAPVSRDERALSEAKEPIRREQADPGSVSSSEGVRSAAPAHPRVRSSSVARPFRPAPKQGKK